MAIDPALVGFEVSKTLQDTLLNYVMSNRRLQENARQFNRQIAQRDKEFDITQGQRSKEFERVQGRLDRGEARQVKRSQDLKAITQELGKLQRDRSRYKGEYAKAIDPLTETSFFGSEIPEDEKRFYFGLPELMGGEGLVRKMSPRQVAEQQLMSRGIDKPTVDPNILERFSDPTLLSTLYPQLLGGEQGGGNYLLSQILNQGRP